MNQCRFIDYNKCTTLGAGGVDGRGHYAPGGGGGGRQNVYGNSVNFPLNFAANLQLFFKIVYVNGGNFFKDFISFCRLQMPIMNMCSLQINREIC